MIHADWGAMDDPPLLDVSEAAPEDERVEAVPVVLEPEPL